MTYTFKLSRRLALSHYSGMLALLALLFLLVLSIGRPSEAPDWVLRVGAFLRRVL